MCSRLGRGLGVGCDMLLLTNCFVLSFSRPQTLSTRPPDPSWSALGIPLATLGPQATLDRLTRGSGSRSCSQSGRAGAACDDAVRSTDDGRCHHGDAAQQATGRLARRCRCHDRGLHHCDHCGAGGVCPRHRQCEGLLRLDERGGDDDDDAAARQTPAALDWCRYMQLSWAPVGAARHPRRGAAAPRLRPAAAPPPWAVAAPPRAAQAPLAPLARRVQPASDARRAWLAVGRKRPPRRRSSCCGWRDASPQRALSSCCPRTGSKASPGLTARRSPARDRDRATENRPRIRR